MADLFNMNAKIDTAGLRKIQDAIPGRLRDVLRLAAFNIERRAKEKVPVDTGATRASITPDFSDLRDFRVTIGASTEYAPFLEFGTASRAARPFMTPALEEETGDFLNAVGQVTGG